MFFHLDLKFSDFLVITTLSLDLGEIKDHSLTGTRFQKYFLQ